MTGTDASGVYEYQVDVFQPNGILASLTAANGTRALGDKPSKAYTAKPPASLDEPIVHGANPYWSWLEIDGGDDSQAAGEPAAAARSGADT